MARREQCLPTGRACWPLRRGLLHSHPPDEGGDFEIVARKQSGPARSCTSCGRPQMGLSRLLPSGPTQRRDASRVRVGSMHASRHRRPHGGSQSLRSPRRRSSQRRSRQSTRVGCAYSSLLGIFDLRHDEPHLARKRAPKLANTRRRVFLKSLAPPVCMARQGHGEDVGTARVRQAAPVGATCRALSDSPKVFSKSADSLTSCKALAYFQKWGTHRRCRGLSASRRQCRASRRAMNRAPRPRPQRARRAAVRRSRASARRCPQSRRAMERRQPGVEGGKASIAALRVRLRERMSKLDLGVETAKMSIDPPVMIGLTRNPIVEADGDAFPLHRVDLLGSFKLSALTVPQPRAQRSSATVFAGESNTTRSGEQPLSNALAASPREAHQHPTQRSRPLPA